MFGLVSWVAMGLLGFYGFAGFLVGTWWVLFCFPVGFCWAEGCGGVVGMVVVWS